MTLILPTDARGLLALLRARFQPTAHTRDDHELGLADALKEQCDLPSPIQDNCLALADQIGEAVGVGPVSEMDQPSDSAKLTYLHMQKQTIGEALNYAQVKTQALLTALF
jgi:hypothetical protein